MKKFHILIIISILLISAALPFSNDSKNQIRVINALDEQSTIKQAQFYADILKIEDANIIIIFVNNLPNNLRGFTLYEEKPALDTKNIVIKLDRNLKPVEQELTLAHEMIHARQFYKHELIHHQENHYHWRGEDFDNIKKIPYRDRKWEKEAIFWEKKLRQFYFDFQKN